MSRGALAERISSFVVRLHRRPEFWVAVVLTVGVFSASFALRHLSELRYLRLHLGAENYNVARAIVDGRGYSDPFAEPTGPTAWVTPLYPLLLSALLYIFRDKSMVGASIVLLTNLSTVIVGTTVYALARSVRNRIPPVLAVVFYSCWVTAFCYWYFLVTSDVWLFSLVVNFMVVTLFRDLATGGIRAWLWGLLGGLASITSAAIGLAWGCLFAYLVLRDRRDRWRRLLVAAAVVLPFLAPWTIRNALVFHRIMPAKSNLGYELYQANIVDDDGIYSKEVFSKHPFADVNERFRYFALGEIDYVDKRRKDFSNYLARRPGDFLRRVGFRALGATLLYVPLTPVQTSSVEVAELRVQRAVYPIPFLMLVTAMLAGCRRSLARHLGVFYLVYLAPYVIVAFYIRYLLPLTPLLALSVYLGLDRVYCLCVGSRDHRSHEVLPTPG